MEMRTPADFPDVNQLLQRSHVRPRTNFLGYAVGVFLLIVLSSAYLTSRWPDLEGLVDAISRLLMIAIMGAMAGLMSWTIRRHRREMKRAEALEELVQLRHWPQALELALQILSLPPRSPQVRAQVLILFSSILARYQRFEDAIAVQTHLLETLQFDEQTAHGIRLGRAMAMLREDHLVDADQAIAELRRMAQDRDSAGLALVQLYRDVKTGHPAEAIEHFNVSRAMFRKQLGHRAGDAYGLVAKAFDALNRQSEAQTAYESATLLTAPIELLRRYPELAPLAQKYAAAALPPELEAAA
jgi:hypothetical protein